MTTTVLTLARETIQALYQKYQSFPTTTPPHTHYQLKLPTLTLTAYLSGKVVLQGSHIDSFLQENQLNAPATTASSLTLPQNFSTWSVAGSDESGNGSYFGPLTVASAYVSQEQIETLQQLGIQDSKKLSDQRIQELVAILKHQIPYHVLVLWPLKYNQVHQYKNLNEMKALMHNQALNLLQKKIAPIIPDGILIDEFCKPSTYDRYLAGQPILNREKIYFSTKAESKHLAVAAASMIARDAFINGLAQLSQEIGYELPSGAGASVDILAAKILKREGRQSLETVAKMHFKNTQKLTHY